MVVSAVLLYTSVLQCFAMMCCVPGAAAAKWLGAAWGQRGPDSWTWRVTWQSNTAISLHTLLTPHNAMRFSRCSSCHLQCSCPPPAAPKPCLPAHSLAAMYRQLQRSASSYCQLPPSPRASALRAAARRARSVHCSAARQAASHCAASCSRRSLGSACQSGVCKQRAVCLTRCMWQAAAAPRRPLAFTGCQH